MTDSQKNGLKSQPWWLTATKISAFTATGGSFSLAKATKYGPPRRMKPSWSSSKNTAKIGSWSQKCWAPRTASKSGKDTSTSWTPGSKGKIGRKRRIAKSWSCSAKLAANGLKSARASPAALKTKSRIASTPISKRTTTSSSRKFRTLTQRRGHPKRGNGEHLKPNLPNPSPSSSPTISSRPRRRTVSHRTASTLNCRSPQSIRSTLRWKIKSPWATTS